NTPWASRGYASKEEWQEALRQREVEKTNEMVRVAKPNEELRKEMASLHANEEEMEMKVYADGRISKRMLITQMGHANMQLAKVIAVAYNETKQYFKSSARYIYNPETETLRDAQTSEVFIESLTKADSKAFNDAAESQDYRVFSESTDINESGVGRFEVKESFIKHLASLP